METSKFTNKTNKIEGVINTEEEEILILNGVYIGNLIHDNVIKDSLNIYTGSKLTGDKIENYFLSMPSETPWKYSIKILSNVDKVYISYEYTGDTVEAEDINNIQNEIVRTQEALNSEVDRATNAEGVLTNNLNTEINRAKVAENVITNIINTNKPNWDDKYSKNETDNKIAAVVTSLDWKESVATFNELATIYPNPEDGWTVNIKDTDITYRYNGSSWIPISANSIPLATSSVDGKMSKQDKIDHDDMNSKKHTHSNKSILDIITQTLLDKWNAAYAHITDAIKHITPEERTLWNNNIVSNIVGDLTSLATEDKANIVEAINENTASLSDIKNNINSQQLANNTDLNTILTPGVRSHTLLDVDARTLLHIPRANITSFSLDVYLVSTSTSTNVVQKITERDGTIWIRSLASSIWGAWKQIATAISIPITLLNGFASSNGVANLTKICNRVFLSMTITNFSEITTWTDVFSILSDYTRAGWDATLVSKNGVVTFVDISASGSFFQINKLAIGDILCINTSWEVLDVQF